MADQQPKDPKTPKMRCVCGHAAERHAGEVEACAGCGCTVYRPMHQLDADDLRRMNVPEEFWTVASSGLPTLTPSVKPIVRNYLSTFEERARKGVGLLLLGGAGVGKTATAVALLKAARERLKTGYFIRAAELREARSEQQAFDADITVMERCRAVDFLVIDDFGESDLTAPWFKLGDLRELVVSRGQRRRPTFITSDINKAKIAAAQPGFFDKVGTYVPDFIIEGPDRREAERERLRADLTKGEG